MLDNYGIRTDLALEATERFTEENVEVRGVEIHEDYNEEKDIRTTVVKITTENGARTMGRPQGSYITIEAPGLSVHDEDYHREISLEIARHLQNVINLERELSILVVGLGNSAITDTGINPGSGVGNHRVGLTEENLQVKVIGIGVPTVVDAATIVHDSMAHLLEALEEAEQKEFLEEMISPHLHTMFVTPKDVDETVKYLSFTISEGLNMAFEEIGG